VRKQFSNFLFSKLPSIPVVIAFIVLLVVAGFHRVVRRKLYTKLNWIRLFC